MFRRAMRKPSGGSSRRRKAVICTERRTGHSLQPSPHTDFPPSPPRSLTADRRCRSAPRTLRVGSAQQDYRCASRRPPYCVEDVSCSGWDLQAETAMTHRLLRVLHDTQRRVRSSSQELIGAALNGSFPEPLASVHIQSSPITLMTWYTVTNVHLAECLAGDRAALAARMIALPRLVAVAPPIQALSRQSTRILSRSSRHHISSS